MKKTLFLSLLLATFVAVGCQTARENNDQDDSGSSTTENPVESALDADTTLSAVRLKNLELCGTLTSDSSVKTCQLKVTDAITLETASKGVDLKACDGLKEAKAIEQCEILVKENQKTANQMEEDKKIMDKVNQVVASGDVSACKDFERENNRMQCESNIYTQQAAEKNDPATCKKISNEFLQESCLSQITK